MDPHWFPAGWYVVDRATRTRTGVSVSLLGREDAIRGAAFPTARTVGPDTASALVPVLVGEALPGAPISWRSGVDTSTLVPSFVVDEDRWQALSSGTDTSGTSTGIAAALGAEAFVDARGVFTMAPVPTLADPVVWRIPYGQALVEPAEEQTSEGLVNVWAISGDAGDGSPAVGPVYVWDDDPNSLTYAGPDPVGDPLAPQRLGMPWVRLRVQRYSSPLITSEAQAYTVGDSKLADSLGVQASLTFTSVCHPGLSPATSSRSRYGPVSGSATSSTATRTPSARRPCRAPPAPPHGG
jgi:hypothetical protein